jgi:fibronectin-binding autotransporter adhesin
MHRIVWITAAAVGLSISLQAEGIIAVATDTGVVAVLDKSKPLRTIGTFRPYGGQGSLYVAVGDVNGDGHDDIVTGAGADVDDAVKIFSQNGVVLTSFLPYGRFTGGVRVATADVTGDGVADIVTGAGPGAPGGHVKVFDGVTLVEQRSLMAYDTAFLGGIYVATADVNGDGFADIITGAGPGSPGGHVKAFDGRTGTELASFLAYDTAFLGGVRVAAGDVNGDGLADIITGPGAGSAAHIKVFDGRPGPPLSSFLAFDPAFLGGVYVGTGSVLVTPGAPSGGIATVRIFGSDGQVQWLMPFPGYTGALTVAASGGAMSKTPARPRIPGFQ